MSDKTTPTLAELLARSRRRYSPAVAAARREEQQRRASKAHVLAVKALTKLHPDDYRSLYEQAIEQVRSANGPLPGDEEA